MSFTDDAGNTESLTNESASAIVMAANNPATGAPTISGTAQVGETLTARYHGHSRRPMAGPTRFSPTIGWPTMQTIEGATGGDLHPHMPADAGQDRQGSG